MSFHVVVGAGPIGSSVATLLADAGEQVRVITRSGRGPDHPHIERIAADAADATRLTALTTGAAALYNCANPRYTRWETDWPPLSSALIAAAQRTGAVLATTGNLYVYGPVDGPMTESTPLAATGRKGRVRIRMWEDALAAGIRTVEVRGSDYIGPAADSVFTFALLPAIEKGATARVPADIDLPHTFTYTGDVARTLVALAADERAWGRAWHVPSPEPITIRELADRFFRVSGRPAVKVVGLPRWLPRLAAPFVPMVRELVEMDYQFYRPFVLDSSLVTRTFGITASDLDEALGTVVRSG
jgi:nucleoside-diphosphate-sugar epimerase